MNRTRSLTLTIAAVLAAAAAAAGQTLMDIPPYAGTYSNAGHTRGLWFTAPADFTITGLRVPDEANHGLQNVEVVKLNAPPPSFSASTNDFVSLARHIGENSSTIIPVRIEVREGDIIGVLGAAGDALMMHNSYSAVSPFQTSIGGRPMQLERFLMQHNLATTPAQNVSRSANPVSRVEIYYTELDPPCYADCNDDGQLTIDDFLCFMDEFAAATSYADCNNDGQLTIDDFLCFMDEFAAGCP